MAATLTIKQRTPFSLVYEMAGDNGAQGTIPGSALAGDCVPGPLKTLLTKLYASSTMNTLNLDSTVTGPARGRIRTRYVEGIATTQNPPTSRTVVWTTTGMQITATAASIGEIEIRFAQSVER
jgi:hypothetical protein